MAKKRKCIYVGPRGGKCDRSASDGSAFCPKHQVETEKAFGGLVQDQLTEDDIPRLILEAVSINRGLLPMVMNSETISDGERYKLATGITRDMPRQAESFGRSMEALERNRARKTLLDGMGVVFAALRQVGVSRQKIAEANRLIRTASRLPIDPVEMRRMLDNGEITVDEQGAIDGEIVG